MTESQAREAFNAAHSKVEEALSELKKARLRLETLSGREVPMNRHLVSTFNQMVADPAQQGLAEF